MGDINFLPNTGCVSSQKTAINACAAGVPYLILICDSACGDSPTVSYLNLSTGVTSSTAPGNIQAYGCDTIPDVAIDFNPVPISYTPTASGNTSNLNSFVIDPNGDMYFIDKDGESFKLNTYNPLDVLTTTQPVPTATGNTLNTNSTFTDINGNIWIVDWKGDAIKIGSSLVTNPITTLTNTVTGHQIGTYTNEAAAVVNINETITSLSLTNSTLTYVDEAGVTNTISLSSIVGDIYKTTSTTCQSIVSTGTITLTVATGLAYTPLQDVIIYADAANHMHGEVVSYNSATGALVVDIKQKSGSGTFCSWVVNLDGLASTTVTLTEQLDEFTAAAGQTSFTLTQTPTGAVKMARNGILLSKTAYSVSGTAVTYIPANNNNNALVAGDRIEFFYEY